MNDVMQFVFQPEGSLVKHKVRVIQRNDAP